MYIGHSYIITETFFFLVVTCANNVISRTQNLLSNLYEFNAENKNERVVCVKNLTPEEVLLQATRLRNALGRKVIKLRTRHVTKKPSVQGTWNPAMKI
jgi:hypothetical protein